MQAEPVAANHEGVDAGFNAPLHVLGCHFVRQALLVVLVDKLTDLEAVEAQDYREVLAAALFDAFDDIKHELGSFFGSTSIFVFATVPPRRQEVMNEVAAAAVDINAIEAGLLGPFGGVYVFLSNILDFGDGERAGHVAMEIAQSRNINC